MIPDHHLMINLGETVEVPVEAGDEDAAPSPEDIAKEEARVYQEEHAKLEAQKQAMMADQVCA